MLFDMSGSSSNPGAPGASVQHIWCNASITKKMEDVLVSFIVGDAQNNKNVSEYIVYLSTLGGSPFSALNLYSFLKSLPQKTTVYNMGTVYSAGVILFLGFQNRFGVADCSFMIHQTTTPKAPWPEFMSVSDLKTEMEKLKSTDERTHLIIEKETKVRAKIPLSLADIQDAALKTSFYDATQSVQHGFIEKVAQPTIPNANIRFLTDQWIATLPG